MNKLLIAAVCFLFLGCGKEVGPSVKVFDDSGIKHKGGYYKRVNIDGVDCVIGTGGYDTTVSVSCDWASKDQLIH